MLLVVGTVRLHPERLADARPAMSAMVTASRAEDGCLGYSYAEDVLEAGLIHVVERWQDRAAFDRHVATGHLAAWRDTWEGLGIGDRRLTMFEVTDEQPM